MHADSLHIGAHSTSAGRQTLTDAHIYKRVVAFAVRSILPTARRITCSRCRPTIATRHQLIRSATLSIVHNAPSFTSNYCPPPPPIYRTTNVQLFIGVRWCWLYNLESNRGVRDCGTGDTDPPCAGYTRAVGKSVWVSYITGAGRVPVSYGGIEGYTLSLYSDDSL